MNFDFQSNDGRKGQLLTINQLVLRILKKQFPEKRKQYSSKNPEHEWKKCSSICGVSENLLRKFRGKPRNFWHKTFRSALYGPNFRFHSFLHWSRFRAKLWLRHGIQLNKSSTSVRSEGESEKLLGYPFDSLLRKGGTSCTTGKQHWKYSKVVSRYV